MSRRLAVKRLAAVEVSPDISNQHEFNAGSLRTELGFSEGRTSGDLSLLFLLEDGRHPELDEGTYTLYDARENHPTRSEYRLYYSTPRFNNLAREGDLLVLFRDESTGELEGIVVRPGTDAEKRIQSALRLRETDRLHKFFFITPEQPTGDVAVTVAEVVVPPDLTSSLSDAVRAHAVYRSSIADAAMPATIVMASAGRDIAQGVFGDLGDPDAFVYRALEAESALFFAIEREVGRRSLQEAIQGLDTEIDRVLAWALRLQQSRKSRRGQSLQHHFGALLTRDGIPHTAQCETERKETPDFVIPGRSFYLNPTYPSNRLRMVACKSTVRERWGQILKEADRIPEKYLLTVDDSLTDEVVALMQDAGLRTFLPKQTLVDVYSGRKAANMLGTVSLLLGNLKAVL